MCSCYPRVCEDCDAWEQSSSDTIQSERDEQDSEQLSDPSEQTSEDSDTSVHENEHDSHGSEEGEARGKRKRVTAPEKWMKSKRKHRRNAVHHNFCQSGE